MNVLRNKPIKAGMQREIQSRERWLGGIDDKELKTVAFTFLSVTQRALQILK